MNNRAEARIAFAETEALQALQGDAGARSYFRLAEKNQILMDCAPELGGVEKFCQTQSWFQHLPVPKIYKQDIEQGFVLLEDFGDEWLFHDLKNNPKNTMQEVLVLLGKWQKETQKIIPFLNPYDEAVYLREMNLFLEYFLPHHQLIVSSREALLLKEMIQNLATELNQWQKVCVHRDWHCRNLMRLKIPDNKPINPIVADFEKQLPQWQRNKRVLKNNGIGILDFQDTLLGSPTYDLISITRDCYIQYDWRTIRRWEESFRQENYPEIASEQWEKLCNQSALQRHLKVLGLFVRLAKNGKPRYLDDLPLVLRHTKHEAKKLNLNLLVNLLERI